MIIFNTILKELESLSFEIEINDNNETIIKKDDEKLSFYITEKNSKFTLQIDHYASQKFRKRFTEGNKQNMECIMSEFLSVVNALFIEKQKEKIEWEQKQIIRQEQQRLFEIEQNKIEKIEAELKSWLHARDLRKYLSELEIKTGESNWVKWGRAYADSLDPVIKDYLQQ